MKRFFITIFIILPFLLNAQEKKYLFKAFEEKYYLSDDLYFFNNSLTDKDGRVLFSSTSGLTRFDSILYSYNGIKYTRTFTHKSGFVNNKGQVIVSYESNNHHLGYFFNEGFCEILQEDKFGFIDQQGKLVIPNKFEQVRVFSEGLCGVRKNGKWGYINTLGKTIIPFKYENVFEFKGGVAIVKCNGLYWGVIDKNGKEILPCEVNGVYQYRRISQFNDTLFIIEKSGTQKLISLSKVEFAELGSYPYENEYIQLYYYPKIYASLLGFINSTLKINYLRVKKDNKYGSIDNNGNIIIPFIYDEISHLNQKYIQVRKGNYSGFLDSNFNEVIPCIYDWAEDFKGGFSKVSKNNLCGFIDESGRVVLPIKHQCDASNLEYVRDKYISENYFPAYAKNYVSPRIEKWQQKGEFESSPEYTRRVNETNRRKLIDQYTEEARQQFWSEQKRKVINDFKLVGSYDADNQSFLFKSDTYGDFVVPVPKEDALGFKYDFQFNMEHSKLDFIDTDYSIGFSRLTFASYGKNFSWTSGSENKYATVRIDYNFSPIEIKQQGISDGNTNLKLENSTISVGKSDVDVNIPITNNVNRKTFVVIFANENYQKEVKVPFAKNDGSTFREYCIKTLGIPAENIRYVADATLNNMRFEINWISDVLGSYSGEASAILYYSGHGVPDESTRNAYLLPVDGFGSDPSTGYSLDQIFQKLGKAPSKSITYFVDACFSGAKKDGGMIKNMKAIEIEVVSSTVLGNAVLFSASKEDQSAHIFDEKGHGLFTYFLLKKLQETQGAVDYTTLANYIKENVERTSIVLKSKKQTPSVTPSHTIGNTWQNWKLK